MKHKLFCILFFCMTISALFAQSASTETANDSIFKGDFYSPRYHVQLVIDLYHESISVPGYEFLGKMNGYMKGDASQYLYGVWMLTNYKIQGNQAELRFTNDIGSDSQTILFTRKADNTYVYSTKNGNNVSKAIGRKLVKIADEMIFTRKAEKLP